MNSLDPQVRRGVTWTLGSLVAVTLLLAWSAKPTRVAAATIADVAAKGVSSCPLTPAQQLNSIKTFLKMMPVFRHPRCLNCHGGTPEPLPQRSQIGGVWQYTAPFSLNHVGVVDLDTTASNVTCEECHMDGWRTGPKWVDKSDMSLCRGMHVEFDHDAAAFIDHIVRDGGRDPFIKAAFVGKRGLNDGGQTIYETETGRTFRPEPPPGTHAELIQKARAWVAAQGGQFVGDKDCGCTVDRVEVNFQSTLKIASDGPAKITGAITGQGKVLLKLGPDLSEPGWDVTTGPYGETAPISWSNVGVTWSNGCTVTILGSPATEFEFWLAMSYQPELKISLQVVPGTDMHRSELRCPNPVTRAMILAKGNDSTPVIFRAAWIALHALPNGASPMPVLGPNGTPPAKMPAGLDLTKLQSLDPAALQAMADAMKNNPTPAGMDQIARLMNQVVPGADSMAAEAANNFKLKIPDNNWCKLTPGTPLLARCDISRTLKKIPDGKGSTQTIIETTTITIGHPPATP